MPFTLRELRRPRIALCGGDILFWLEFRRFERAVGARCPTVSLCTGDVQEACLPVCYARKSRVFVPCGLRDVIISYGMSGP